MANSKLGQATNVGAGVDNGVVYCPACKKDVLASKLMGFYFCPDCGKGIPVQKAGNVTIVVNGTVMRAPNERTPKKKRCSLCGFMYVPSEGSYCEVENCCPTCKRKADDINDFAYRAFLK